MNSKHIPENIPLNIQHTSDADLLVSKEIKDISSISEATLDKVEALIDKEGFPMEEKPITTKEKIAHKIVNKFSEKVSYLLGTVGHAGSIVVAFSLVGRGKGAYVAKHVNKFAPRPHVKIDFNFKKEIGVAIIECGGTVDILNNLENFAGLEEELFVEMLKVGESEEVMKKLTHLAPSLRNKIICGFLKAFKLNKFMLDLLGTYKDLDREVVVQLAKQNNLHHVIEIIGCFDTEGRKQVVLWLIDAKRYKGDDRHMRNPLGEDMDAIWRLDKTIFFIDIEIASALIDAKQFKFMRRLLPLCPEPEQNYLALSLIRAGEWKMVYETLDKVDSRVAQSLIWAAYNDREGAYWKERWILKKYTNFDENVALTFIAVGAAREMVDNLEKFHITDYCEIISTILNHVSVNGQTWDNDSNAARILRVKGEIGLVKKLIEAGHKDFIEKHLEDLSLLDNEIAQKISLLTVARNLKSFEGLDDRVAVRLIENYIGDFNSDDFLNACSFTDTTPLPLEYCSLVGKESAILRDMRLQLSIKTIMEYFVASQKYASYLSWLSTNDKSWILSPSDIAKKDSYHVSLNELHILKEQNCDISQANPRYRPKNGS